MTERKLLEKLPLCEGDSKSLNAAVSLYLWCVMGPGCHLTYLKIHIFINDHYITFVNLLQLLSYRFFPL